MAALANTLPVPAGVFIPVFTIGKSELEHAVCSHNIHISLLAVFLKSGSIIILPLLHDLLLPEF